MSAFLEMHRYLATLETSTAQQRGESKVMVEDPDATSSFAPVVPVPSDDEQQPRSKLRRRWRMQSTTAPVTPPLPTTLVRCIVFRLAAGDYGRLPGGGACF